MQENLLLACPAEGPSTLKSCLIKKRMTTFVCDIFGSKMDSVTFFCRWWVVYPCHRVS